LFLRVIIERRLEQDQRQVKCASASKQMCLAAVICEHKRFDSGLSVQQKVGTIDEQQ
jgi:hypothetical protein